MTSVRVFFAAMTMALLSSGADALPGPELGAAANCPAPAEEIGGPSNADSRTIAASIVPALTGTATKPTTILERLHTRYVPGVSVAVIRGGKLAWARGWGLRDTGTCEPVTPATAFQAASITKAFAAVLAMRLVEEGRLSLDTDINQVLTRWHLPSDPRYPPGYVTLRQLLDYTAGVSAAGYGGYSPGAPLPNLIEILDGKTPANSPAVRLETKPGVASHYSGGGYMIVQAAIEDVTHTSFTELASRDILRPLRMSRSSFSQPASADILSNAATGHFAAKPFVEKFHVYPELAAAGLWTTPSDLARFLIDIRAAKAGEGGHLVSAKTAAEMLKPAVGDEALGFAYFGRGTRKFFGGIGGNWGFLSQMVIDPESGDGIVVMTNGEQGLALAAEIIRAAANHYGWASFRSRPLMETVQNSSLFLHGSVNGAPFSLPLKASGRGVWEVETNFVLGAYEMKVDSKDGIVSLGSDRLEPTVAPARDVALATDSNNLHIKIPAAGTYRVSFHADATGAMTLSVMSR